MRVSRTVLVLIFPIIMLLVVVPVAKAELDDLVWERQGQLKLVFGWYGGEGVFAEKEPEYGIKAGVGFATKLDISGRLSDDCSELNYYVQKMPGKTASIHLHWNGPETSAQYENGIILALPEVSLTFKNNAIDGFELHTPGGFSLFAGKQYYYPKKLSFIIANPNNNFYQLFNLITPIIILGDGIIVEASELITLNGEILQRGSDYKLNYMNGRLWLYCPFEQGDLVEVKFQFLYDEKYRIPGEFLKGVLFNRQMQESSLTGFYFAEGELKQIAGAAGEYVFGPLSIKGEWAVAKNDQTTQAYYLDCLLKEENLTVICQMMDIDQDFEEIGTNAFTQGKLQNFEMRYSDEDYDFSLQRKFFVLPDRIGWHKLTTTGVLQGEIAAHQYWRLILQQVEGGSDVLKNDKNLAVGYVFDLNPLKFSLVQSIQDLDRRVIQLNINWPKMNITADYGVELKANGKMHKTRVGLLYLPSKLLKLNSNVEYKHFFGAEKGDYWVNLNGAGEFLPGFYGEGEFTLNTNYRLNSGHTVEKVVLNYGQDEFNSNFYFYRTDVQSAEAQHYAQEIMLDGTLPLSNLFEVGYQFQKSDAGHYPLTVSLPDEETEQVAHTISLNYFIKPNLICSADLELSQNGKRTILNEVNTVDKSVAAVYGVGMEYQANDGTKMGCSVNYTTLSEERLLTVLNDLKYFILGAEISLTGKTVLTFPQRKQTSGVYEVGLVLPTVCKIQPGFAYKNEYWNVGSTGCETSYSILLKYLQNEHRPVFLEVKRYACLNWTNPTENYLSLGIFSGVEFNF